MLTFLTFLCLTTATTPSNTPTNTEQIKFNEMALVEETSAPKPQLTYTNERKR